MSNESECQVVFPKGRVVPPQCQIRVCVKWRSVNFGIITPQYQLWQPMLDEMFPLMKRTVKGFEAGNTLVG